MALAGSVESNPSKQLFFLSVGDKLILLLAAFPFSAIGVRALTFGGRFMPEPYLLAIAFLAFATSRRRLGAFLHIARNRNLWILIWVATLIALVGGFRPDFSPIAFYGRYRALLLFLLGLWMGVHYSNSRREAQFWEAVAFFGLFSGLFSIASQLNFSGTENAKEGFAPLAFAIPLFYFSTRQKSVPTAAISVLLAAAAFLSFFRQNYFIAAWAIAAAYANFLPGAIKLGNNTVKIRYATFFVGLFPVLAFAAIQVFWSDFVAFLSSSESRYIHSIGKMEDLIAFANGSGPTGGGCRQSFPVELCPEKRRNLHASEWAD